MSIKRIYKGLPEDLIEKVFWVGRKFRTNPLSHIEGGTDVVVEYHNDDVYGYDWIKDSESYVKAILFRKYKEIQVINVDEQLSFLKKKVKSIYGRSYDKSNYSNVPFEQVWNHEASNVLPWKALEKFGSNNSDTWKDVSEEIETVKLLRAEGKRVNFLLGVFNGFKFILPDYYFLANIYRNGDSMELFEEAIACYKFEKTTKDDLVTEKIFESEDIEDAVRNILNCLSNGELVIKKDNHFISSMEILHTTEICKMKIEDRYEIDIDCFKDFIINDEIVFSTRDIDDRYVVTFVKGVDLKN